VSGLFREEALAELRNRSRPGDVLRMAPRGLHWALWGLLALVAIGVAASLIVHVPEDARGAAIAGRDGRSVSASLPPGVRGQVEPGASAWVDIGALRRAATVVGVRFGAQGLVAQARLRTPLPASAARTGRLSVHVRGQTIFQLLAG
jgi:hypothetical protein